MLPTCLVTGANGFTGKYLCLHLARQGIHTRGMYWALDGDPDYEHENLEFVAGDLRDRDSLKNAIGGVQIVYNIAALYRPTNVTNQMFWDANVEGVRNMIELAADASVQRFVHCSTIGVHGDIDNPPADESAPIKPADYYQYTKLKGEEMARDRGCELGLPVAIIRPAAIYGPYENRFLKLPKLIQQGKFIMFGDGKVLYHFIHIDDLCDAFVRCSQCDEAVGQTYIIADDHAITLNQIVAVIAEELGIPAPRWRLPLSLLYGASIICEYACKPFRISPPLHRRRASWFSHNRSFTIAKAQREIGYVPQTKTEEGLRDMVRSYRQAGWIN